MRADAAAHRDRRRKADPVQPVVHAHHRVVDADGLGHQVGQQRQREIAVRDRSTERTFARALRVDVDPLVVGGRVGEAIDAVLVDRDPVADDRVLADDRLEIGDRLKRPHAVSLFDSFRPRAA